jgi:hypothetical protein
MPSIKEGNKTTTGKNRITYLKIKWYNKLGIDFLIEYWILEDHREVYQMS